MFRSTRSIARLRASAVLGLSVAACVLGSATVASAASGTPSSPCASGLAVVVSSPTGELQPACVTQQGNVLVIALARDIGNGRASSLNTPPTTLNTTPASLATPTPGSLLTNLSSPPTNLTSLAASPTALAAPPNAEPDMSAVTDSRIDSYTKRQAIRDQYRGQMDETTFNDELGDGVPLETALNDALAAFHRPHP